MNIKDLLEENGYEVIDCGNYYKTSANWRGGQDLQSVTIYKNGVCIDHVTGDSMSHKSLIGRILNIDDKNKLEEYLEKNDGLIENKNNQIIEPIIQPDQKILEDSFLDKLDRSDAAQNYWINRGISLNILKELGGGTYKDRYYFPVWNVKKQLIGLTSRDIIGNSKLRWKHHKSKKSEWLWPFADGKEIIKNKKVFLVEGIGCALSLMTCNIKNVLVLFGTECSFTIINNILKIPDIKIIISTNSDGAGVFAAGKIYRKLKKYFDSYNIQITLPKDSKDWNDVLLNEGMESIIEQLKNYNK